jgi:outer membrane protein assembly factor BamA
LTFGHEPLPAGRLIRIDSIHISKNWRTKDAIIREELGFREGELVNQGMLDTMVIRIWNIGNFAKVGYELDTLPGNKYLLEIMARDALTIVPALGFSGNRQDWSLSAGVSDNNFLGRNIRFDIGGSIGTNAKAFKLGINIPRQLLYKNMSVSGSIVYGQGKNFRFENREKSSVIAYTKKQISGGISNPWDEDFKYRFSPNISWSIFQHIADSNLVDTEIPWSGNYTINYLSVSVGESIGYIRRMRHQKDGWRASVGVGVGIGLDKNSPLYYSVGAGMDFHELLNPVVQFSAEFNTGYTSTTIPSLLFYHGANAVKGILTGEISGQSYYTAYVGWHFTYINRDWFAMEQSVYLNWGNGNDCYTNLYNTQPLYGIGTGFYFNIPMIPWLSMRVYFTYSGQNSNWFRLEL